MANLITSQKPYSKKAALGCLVLVILTLAIGFTCNNILCSDTDKSNNEYKPDSSMAYVMSKEFVKRNLKSPATAEFPVGIFAHYEGDSVYIVNSYVDAQNTFGALIRTEFYVKIKDNGNDNWKLIDIKLYE